MLDIEKHYCIALSFVSYGCGSLEAVVNWHVDAQDRTVSCEIVYETGMKYDTLPRSLQLWGKCLYMRGTEPLPAECIFHDHK